MDLSEFTANYAPLSDDELLRWWADRNTLVPEAVIALDSELQKRRLRKENAIRAKKRLDALTARTANDSSRCGEVRAQHAALRRMVSLPVLVGCIRSDSVRFRLGRRAQVGE